MTRRNGSLDASIALAWSLVSTRWVKLQWPNVSAVGSVPFALACACPRTGRDRRHQPASGRELPEQRLRRSRRAIAARQLPPRFVADAVRETIDVWQRGALDLASRSRRRRTLPAGTGG